MTTETIPVPDLGGADEVEVIEICVAVGDSVQAEDSLVVLESDKASMEIPSPRAGRITAIRLAVGDKVNAGDPLVEMAPLEGADAGEEQAEPPAPAAEEQAVAAEASTEAAPEPAPAPEAAGEPRVELIRVPDLGTSDEVDVIEVPLRAGDTVEEGASLVVLESDKASMDVPSPMAGTVRSIKVAEGDRVSTGSPLLELEVAAAAPAEARPESEPVESRPAPAPSPAPAAERKPSSFQDDVGPASTAGQREAAQATHLYAGPAVRKLAREMGISLEQVPGTGPKGRILKSDVQGFVQEVMAGRGVLSGSGIPAIPEVDFARFGEVDVEPMSRLHKATAANMHRSWLNVPHVTQFDEADVTELEAFRTSLRAEAEERGTRLTPLPLLLKACAAALQAHPGVNVSLTSDEQVVRKRYIHIGMAVDTPAGLVVPVIRDVNRKSLWELAEEVAELAEKARQRKLTPNDMQGGGFTLSSLGALGGQGFTPIVNAPEVAILGVSRLAVKPVWDGSEFVPRKMLPLSLSYDHKALNGGDAGRFLTHLVELLGDIRRMLL